MIDKDTKLIFSVSTNPGNTGTIIHNSLFEKHGLNYIYKSLYVAPADFTVAIDGMRVINVHGCSISMPFKRQAAMAVLAIPDADIARLGVVNTLIRHGKHAFFGYNTDVDAIVQLLAAYRDKIVNPTIIGAGATAHSMLVALSRLAINNVCVWNRSIDHLFSMQYLANLLGIHCRVFSDINQLSAFGNMLINCTSCGMEDDFMLPILDIVGPSDYVFDVVPKRTALIKHALQQGVHVFLGQDMAIEQSLLQFELYTGIRIDYDAERDFVKGLI